MVNENMLQNAFSQVNKVYDSLMDDQSKKLFALRLLYNSTNDWNYVLDMTSLIPEFNTREMQSFRTLYKQYKTISNAHKPIIIYGAGKWGRYLYDLFSQLFGEIIWHCFCDKDPSKQNNTYCNLPVISPVELIDEYKDAFVIIGTRDYQDEVYRELVSMGFPADHILSSDIQYQIECLFDKQYFESPIVMPQENEVFVDAGCFNCDTSILFKKWCNEKYEKIYAFEPDPLNYEKCIEIIKQTNLEKMELFNAGLWSKKQILHFNNEGNSGSSIMENGLCKVDVVSLDDVLNGQRVSFIKMDIEGAELEALKGAKDSIVTYRPRLAICIYHKPEDILEIPLYLQSLVPDYKFYIRHYSNYTVETVLYAI